MTAFYTVSVQQNLHKFTQIFHITITIICSPGRCGLFFWINALFKTGDLLLGALDSQKGELAPLRKLQGQSLVWKLQAVVFLQENKKFCFLLIYLWNLIGNVHAQEQGMA